MCIRDRYRTYSKKGQGRSAESHYPTMCIEDIKALPVGELAAKDCALFQMCIRDSNYAVQMDYIEKNPLKKIGNFKSSITLESEKEMDYYTPDEFCLLYTSRCV